MTAVDIAPKSASSPSKDEVVVSVRGLTKVFKDFWNRPKARAVDGVDFEVRRGEVFGLLGPNGSGKSTTVKLMLGLLNPTKGHIEVFGHSPRHVQTKARIGYLPEESYLYRYLNSRETLDFLKERQIPVHVLPTQHAVALYNKLAQTEAVGGLFHTTC